MSYDGDVATFNPQGKILQINYAMEAPKLGSTSLGICSKTHAILVAIRRQMGPLSAYQNKIYEIDSHVGICVSGIYADARKIIKILRSECVEHTYVYDSLHSVKSLVTKLADESQARTQFAGYRPFGVSLLVAGIEGAVKKTPKLFITLPSGEYFEYKAASLGGRSQTVTTALIQNKDRFENATLDELVMLALDAVGSANKDCRPTKENLSIGVVSIEEGSTFHLIEQAAIDEYISKYDELHPALTNDEDTDDLD